MKNISIHECSAVGSQSFLSRTLSSKGSRRVSLTQGFVQETLAEKALDNSVAVLKEISRYIKCFPEDPASKHMKDPLHLSGSLSVENI